MSDEAAPPPWFTTELLLRAGLRGLLCCVGLGLEGLRQVARVWLIKPQVLSAPGISVSLWILGAAAMGLVAVPVYVFAAQPREGVRTLPVVTTPAGRWRLCRIALVALLAACLLQFAQNHASRLLQGGSFREAISRLAALLLDGPGRLLLLVNGATWMLGFSTLLAARAHGIRWWLQVPLVGAACLLGGTLYWWMAFVPLGGGSLFSAMFDQLGWSAATATALVLAWSLADRWDRHLPQSP